MFPSAIKTLEELLELVGKFQNLYSLFWNRTQFNHVERYLNREYQGDITKELTQELDQFCKESFSTEIVAAKAIPTLQAYQDILKSIASLDSYKIDELERILGVNQKGKKYCQLLGSKN